MSRANRFVRIALRIARATEAYRVFLSESGFLVKIVLALETPLSGEKKHITFQHINFFEKAVDWGARLRGRTLRGGVLGTFWKPPSKNPFWEPSSEPRLPAKPIASPLLKTLLGTVSARGSCLGGYGLSGVYGVSKKTVLRLRRLFRDSLRIFSGYF